MRFLLHQEEPGLSLRPAAASVDLGAFNRLDEFLLVGLVDLHLMVACSALEHRRVQSWTHPRDFGGHGVDGDEATDVVGSQL